jgi:hypothetical protein
VYQAEAAKRLVICPKITYGAHEHCCYSRLASVLITRLHEVYEGIGGKQLATTASLKRLPLTKFS